ncbi:GNAT family N-acetyltransferase [Criblamydia sequanensis]|uniref:Acetyltransferase, GNAT family n=1 Tax=Candidatus Criblamydia sequanensis CRIB-18 TaxID=1437425 RepID=A0A090D298_9BACT|nr:GNAT family N-acetyltransferase [Criblamydia sequanensis]CDR34460.1 Acetyltransferase, GNAT family [Criblamydia sequanensis CRIB-18]
MQIERITNNNQETALKFLNKYEDSAVFLIGNLERMGPDIGESQFSGNFKMVLDEDKIIAVFCLTKGGTLLVQSEVVDPLFKLILKSCEEEKIPIKGLIGEWAFGSLFWEHLKSIGVIKKENYFCKEVNYTLNLKEWKGHPSLKARALSLEDYQDWKLLRMDYLEEQGLPTSLSEKERVYEYGNKVKNSLVWGLFEENRLLSIAEINAKTNQIGTVGGVYTVESERKKGHGRALMNRLIHDCKENLQLRKLIIFTGEKENIPAQKLYESLGCQKVGHLALCFGE